MLKNPSSYFQGHIYKDISKLKKPGKHWNSAGRPASRHTLRQRFISYRVGKQVRRDLLGLVCHALGVPQRLAQHACGAAHRTHCSPRYPKTNISQPHLETRPFSFPRIQKPSSVITYLGIEQQEQWVVGRGLSSPLQNILHVKKLQVHTTHNQVSIIIN